MCRLLGYAAASPTCLRTLIGDSELDRFAALSRLHGDGWGTSWLEDGEEGPGRPEVCDRLRTSRSTRAAAADPHFAEIAGRGVARARTVHLRWATQHYAIDLANTHPFSADGMSLAHNGAIAPRPALDAMLTPSMTAQLEGDTDSERYFALIRQGVVDDPDPDRVAVAAARAASALRAQYPDASLNALLLTTDRLVIVHANSPRSAPLEELRAQPGGAPLDHVEAYFLMRWVRTADGSLIFASSGLTAQDWTALPEESVTSVDLGTLEMRHLLIAEHDPSGLVA
ncbi:MAG: gamma-glutamyl hercynylcysteine S-oxide hydrolase [Pseudonocardiales bacterium]|nr:gamma-glutamyl hercynylcysteine S-oxide hydrolase [Pseudonocardiales bacterium]